MSSKTLHSAVRPVLSWSKLLGLVSFKVDQNKYTVSRLNVALNIVASAVYVCATIATVYIRAEYMKTEVLSTTTDIMQLFAAMSQIIVTWTCSAIFQQRHIDLLHKLDRIGKQFQSLGVWIYYSSIQRTIFVQLIVRFIVVTSCAASQFLFYENNDKKAVAFYIMYLFPIFMNSALIQQVSMYILIIKGHFKTVNQHLSELQKGDEVEEENAGKYKVLTFLGSKQSILKIICPLHHDLRKIVTSINSTFGVPLLMTFGVSFVVIIANIYYSIMLIQNLDKSEINTLIATMANCIPYITETMVFCHLCNSTSEEANESGTLIHKIESYNANVNNEVEIFSLQLAHEKVEFNAGGFFPINYTLIFSIIGGVTTNLVILIQFSTNAKDDSQNATTVIGFTTATYST